MASNAGSINLNELPVPQLKAVGQQLEEEIQVLTASFGQLKQAQIKFNDGIDTLKRMISVGSSSEKEALIPLTNSLYVSGTLESVDRVVIDVGTGYFIEKTIPQAQEYFKRKIEYVKGNLSKLEEQINQRQGQRKVLYSVLQQKMMEESKSAPAVEAN